MKRGLEALLNPNSIALLGASAQPGKAGHTILGRLLEGGFHPYLVNPRGDSVQGISVYHSLSELPEAPDLAILAVPAEATPAAAAECASMGVGAVIAVAGGFGEAGEAGRDLEQQLGQAIHGSPTRLLGPNTLGVMVPAPDWIQYSCRRTGSSGLEPAGLPWCPRAAPRWWGSWARRPSTESAYRPL